MSKTKQPVKRAAKRKPAAPVRRRKPSTTPTTPVVEAAPTLDTTPRPLYQAPSAQETLDQVSATENVIEAIREDISLLEGARETVQQSIDELFSRRSQIDNALGQRYATLQVYQEKRLLDVKLHSVVINHDQNKH